MTAVLVVDIRTHTKKAGLRLISVLSYALPQGGNQAVQLPSQYFKRRYTHEEGIRMIAQNINETHQDPATGEVITVLETMASQGNHGDFPESAE
jgi:endonuclease IV